MTQNEYVMDLLETANELLADNDEYIDMESSLLESAMMKVDAYTLLEAATNNDQSKKKFSQKALDALKRLIEVIKTFIKNLWKKITGLLGSKDIRATKNIHISKNINRATIELLSRHSEKDLIKHIENNNEIKRMWHDGNSYAYKPGNPIDRDVLVMLKGCLTSLTKFIDECEKELAKLKDNENMQEYKLQRNAMDTRREWNPGEDFGNAMYASSMVNLCKDDISDAQDIIKSINEFLSGCSNGKVSMYAAKKESKDQKSQNECIAELLIEAAELLSEDEETLTEGIGPNMRSGKIENWELVDSVEYDKYKYPNAEYGNEKDAREILKTIKEDMAKIFKDENLKYQIKKVRGIYLILVSNDKEDLCVCEVMRDDNKAPGYVFQRTRDFKKHVKKNMRDAKFLRSLPEGYDNRTLD